MKKLATLCIFLASAFYAFAQTPQKMGYQAVIRNPSNQLVINTNVGFQVSILRGGATGTPVYVERHFPRTNANGLVSVDVGSGTIVLGTFASVDWSNSTYFIKTETDLNGGSNYTITGTSQLMSVPYALQAKTAEIAVKANVADSSDYRKLANKPILTPLAWGNIQFGSTAVYGSSGNFTVSRTPENFYRITFAASSGICPNSNKSIVSVNTLGTAGGVRPLISWTTTSDLTSFPCGLQFYITDINATTSFSASHAFSFIYYEKQ